LVKKSENDYESADSWERISCSEKFHTAAEKLGQMHLELPLAAFQPGLCHPHLFEALVGMAADDYKKIVDVAAPRSGLHDRDTRFIPATHGQ
jgi:hypothetical protein